MLGVVISSLLLMKLVNGRLIQVVGELDDDIHGTISKNEKYVIPSHIQLSWLEAQDYCESTYGTDLASIYSNEDEIELYDLLQSIYKISIELGLGEFENIDLDSHFSNIWIGANDIDNNNEWKWINNYGYKEEITYTNWCQTEGRRLYEKSDNYFGCSSIQTQYKCWVYDECDFNVKYIFACNYNSRSKRGKRRSPPPETREPDQPC